MNRVIVLSVSVFLLLSVFTVSIASSGEPRVRQVQQRARIHHGVHRGSLLPREARALRSEQRIIQKNKKQMLANDGKLGPAERARLERMQNRASRHIFRAKHNTRAR